MAREEQHIAPENNDLGAFSDGPVRDRTLSDRVYERVLAKIVNGEIPVGSKLPTEHTLCAEMQVSRPILRQALKQLRSDEIIVSRQGSGSFVKRRPEGAILEFAPVGSIADIQRTFEFRAAIEAEAAQLAAIRRTEKDVELIGIAIKELDECIEQNKLGVDADEKLHDAICRAADNNYFVAARNSMKANILSGMNVTRNLSMTKARSRLELVQQEHYEIFDAIKAHDGPGASAAMRAHIENARRRVFDGNE